MNYINRCIIVPAAFTPLARALCEGLTPGDSGKGMFTTPLSNDIEVTHYISAGMIEDRLAFLLPLTTFGDEASTTTGQSETIVELAQGAVSLSQINALLAAISVTDEDPYVAMARLDLHMIQDNTL